MDYEKKTINWKPLSEYKGGRVLATNDLDILIGEINSNGDCADGDGCLLCGITAFADIEDIMPKPKESEDEKIRKEILRHFVEKRNMLPTKVVLEEWIAWLEKQGTSYTKKDVDDAYVEGVAFAKDELKKQYEANYQTRKDIATFIFNYRGDIKDRAKWMDYLGIKASFVEKQSEQKFADKIEPKFHEGEWVVFIATESIYQVEKIENYEYTLRHIWGGSLHLSFSSVELEELVRKWTIQDAKDGDVLAFNDGHGNDCIELIKSITGKKIEFWFCLTNGNSYEVFDGITPYTNLASREDATPATKEQRDFLFQKMKDAGYEWDAEKKELKKLAHQEVTKVSDQETSWKPSDEQLRALNYVVNLMASSESPKENDYYYNVFKDLREQLKELKEE